MIKHILNGASLLAIASYQSDTAMEAGNGTKEVQVYSKAQDEAATQKAAAFGASIGEETDALFAEQVIIIEKSKISALVLMMQLRADLGDEAMKNTPVPGTTSEDTNNPDTWMAWVTGANGKRKQPRSFWKLAAHGSPTGKEYKRILDGISAAANDKRSAPAEFSKMNPLERGRIKEQTIGRMKSLEKLWLKAAACAHQLYAFEGLPLVTVSFCKTRDPDDKESFILEATDKPVLLQDAENPLKDFDYFSINSFLSIRVDDLHKGSTYDDVIEAMSREQPDAENVEPLQFDEVPEHILRLSNFLGGAGNQTALFKAMKKNDDNAKSLILEVIGLARELAPFEKAFGGRYNAYENEIKQELISSGAERTGTNG